MATTKELEKMPIEDVRAQIVSLKEHYDKLKLFNMELYAKNTRSATREKRLLQDI